ncbi:hypothetical protein ABZ816_28830 [Actinosynnema sp. NPDC047251]|uniref:Uncharacterized protein n=1 Tax=Saccharothrix espanaensis (strain ATCC 51144 / DSM 44229 / JCM 9112 / NBRC 15066 / NRRL 15764) TaxID=1179773 RepID=K0JW13_SACES|nr:hypothetical protein [Saccharothrix espanaensis]CCH28393.1 hypothetical protein BN6_10650 [Saccharothrix espanaensis DSM 44229]
MNAYADLVRELKSLRKGRGVLADGIGGRVGPSLRATCGVTEGDEPGAIRRKVSARLTELAGRLPADLRLATLAAFAIECEARLPLYQDRVHWAAVRMDRDPRTVRRRVDEAINHLAELAAEAPRDRPDGPSVGWRTAELHVVLVLDRSHPEVIERHRIVADRDGLRELTFTPPLPLDRPGVDVRVLYGGTLVDRSTPTLALPTTVIEGHSHDFAIRLRPPTSRVMRPYLLYVPQQPCDLLVLRGRFGDTGVPPRVWALHGASQRDGVDLTRHGNRRVVDQAGEIHVRFRRLVPGLAYGVRWEASSD